MYVSNLSRDYIYKTFSQESIFEAYGIPVVKGNFVSPLRRDKSPTCAFQYYGNILRYYDNRPGEFSGDAIAMVMHLKNLSYQEALLDIYNTLKLNSTDSCIYLNKKSELIELYPRKSTEIKLKFKEFSKKELEYWNQYGIGLDTLQRFNIHSCSHLYTKNKDEDFKNCMRDSEMCFVYIFADNSVKAYFPERKEYRFISNSRWIQGIEYIDNPELLVITKSYKDVVCLSLFGIQAVAMQGESVLPPAKLVNKYNCVYLADNDAPGKRAAVLMRKKYNIPIALFPQEYREMGIKDFSDAYQILGHEFLKDLLTTIL
jgi:hypothetical protein